MQTNRRNWLKKATALLTTLTFSKTGVFANRVTQPIPVTHPGSMPLGAFSISLNVKDLSASKAFYESLGFTAFTETMSQNYLIMKNGNALVGLFRGMFQNNILTFNPGWDENAKPIPGFTDVRNIQKHLKEKGIKLSAEADESGKGPAYLMLTDPDGNAILIDQHV